MRVSELSGAQLDYWVAKAEGYKHVRVQTLNNAMGLYCIVTTERAQMDGLIGDELYYPSTSWAQGGPIIEREEISLLPGPWSAQVFLEDGLRSFEGMGPTPLIAAMRAIVACKYGKEVPDEVEK